MAAHGRRYQLTIYTLIVFVLAFVIVEFIPDALSVQNIGLQGVYRNGQFVIEKVEFDSPASAAGLQAGDVVTSIDGQSMETWHKRYHTQLSEYHAERAEWVNQPVLFTFKHQGETRSAQIQAKPLSLRMIIHYYIVHLVVVGSLLIMIIFIMSSNPKDARAFLVALSFLGMAMWIAADLPGWPGFMRPLIPTYSMPVFLLRDTVFTYSLQFVLSIFIHILLVFPSQWVSDRTLKRLMPIVYALPTGAMLLFTFVMIPRPIADNLTTLAEYRLQFDTALLILTCVLIVTSYRLQKSPIEKEQARWIVRALLFVTTLHLVLWNIPKVVFGDPLIANYNWLYLLLVLIPLSLTVAIANHRIFGIRGLARRRLSMLTTLLDRERSMVQRRDGVIRDLASEIQHLRDELHDYEVAEQPQLPEVSVSEELLQLENDYPEIRRVRESELLGKSPAWGKVFREAVLAAHGDVPVVIIGESGTGKTELARTVYRISDRNGKTYRQISCAQFEHADPAFALGKLFGVGKGHGLPNVPKDGQPGLLEECNGGVLFLDDFDRLPLNVQDLLLYPLEGKAFEPGIGTGKPREVSVKFILATNRDPGLLVSKGELQGDVLARMGARITIPPMRERPEDIPVLVQHFLGRLSKEFDHVVETVSPKAMNMLMNFPYSHGNARELYAELRQAVGKASLEKDSVLRAGYLSNAMQAVLRGAVDGHATSNSTTHESHHRAAESPNAKPSTEPASDAIPRELRVLRSHDFQILPSERELGLSNKSKTLSNHLRGLCIKALAENDWQPDRAAHALAPENSDKVVIKLERKIERYLRTVQERVADGTTTRLYTNLPASYHDALARAIQWVKK